MYYLGFLELGTGTCEASASSMLREGDWDHIRDMIQIKYVQYQDIQRPLLREEGDGAPASSGTQ